MTKIKGWYYDKQLESPLTSVTLHANKWWKANENGEGGEFINWDQIKGENGFGNHGNECDKDLYERLIQIENGACGYGLDPICTSILNEDFGIAISNTWSEFGGDPIGDMWNSLRGPMSGVAKPIVDSLNTLLTNNEEHRNNGDENKSNFVRKIEDAIHWIREKKTKYVDSKDVDVVSFLNKALITQGTRFSYYGGTGIAFGNLGMKFTIFPQWKNNEFIEVQKQVEKLYPYFIGQVESFESATGIKGDEDSNYLGQAANRCFMFQKPPGGYLTEMLSIDKIQEGTLKLKIGGFYEITNLVCSDIMLNFSKNMVKNPIDNTISPLFCDVTISLRASTKYSDIMLRKFIGGDISSRRTISDMITKNLEDESKKLENIIDTKIGDPEIEHLIDHD